MNHENMLSEGSQSQKITYCLILFTGNVQNRQIYRSKVDQWSPRAGGGEGEEKGRTIVKGYGAALGSDKM